MVMTFDFDGFYAYSFKPNRTNFLRQLRQIVKKSWIDSVDQQYYLSVKKKWQELGYSDIPIAENEDQAIKLLKAYLGVADKIIHYVDEEVDINFPMKEIWKRQAFQSRFSL